MGSAAGRSESTRTATPRIKEAAWAFIKWVTSPAVHKDLNLHGAGSDPRKSEMTDPELLADIDSCR